LAIILVPFGFVCGDAVLGRLGLAERHLRERQNLHIVVADQADVYLASFDQLLDDGRLMELRLNEFDALREAGIILHDRRLRDAVGSELGLEVRQFREQRPDVIANPDHENVVPARDQRASDVIFRLFGLLLDLALKVRVFPLGMQRVENDGDLHDSARRGGPDTWRSSALTRFISWATVESAISITTPPSRPTAGSSNMAVRRLPV